MWTGVKSVAFGQLNITEHEWEFMSPKYWKLKLHGFDQLQKFHNRQSWEQTRALAYFVISPYLKKGSNKKPQDILPFDWDSKPLTGKQLREFVTANKDLYDKLVP